MPSKEEQIKELNKELSAFKEVEINNYQEGKADAYQDCFNKLIEVLKSK